MTALVALTPDPHEHVLFLSDGGTEGTSNIERGTSKERISHIDAKGDAIKMIHG